MLNVFFSSFFFLLTVPQEIDFSTVSEGLINSAILATRFPDHQKAAKHRLLQCIKYRPRLRDIVAWIACNKGSHFSLSFCRILNQVFSLGAGAAQGGTEGSSVGAEQTALSSVLRVSGESPEISSYSMPCTVCS